MCILFIFLTKIEILPKFLLCLTVVVVLIQNIAHKNSSRHLPRRAMTMTHYFQKTITFRWMCYLNTYRVFNKYGTSKIALGVMHSNKWKFKIIILQEVKDNKLDKIYKLSNVIFIISSPLQI